MNNKTPGSVLIRLFLLCISILIFIKLDFIQQSFGYPLQPNGVAEKVSQILLWVTGAMFLIAMIRIVFWEGIIQRSIGRKPPRLLMQLGGVFIYFLTLTGMMTLTFDQPIGGFLTASGAVGIVIAFALRSLILDTVSGLAIHIESPFVVGNWIICHTRFGEYIGRVEETNWRTTRLWTTSRNIITIPNSFLTTTVVTNLSAPRTESRFELEFTLDYSVPTDRAIRVLTAAVQESIGPDGPVENPSPKVRADHVSQYGVIYKIRYYLDPVDTTPGKARSRLIDCVIRHVNHAGLTLAYPKRDLYVTRMPWRQTSWQNQEDQISQLAKISIFSGLLCEDLEIIAKNMFIHELNEHDTIVSEKETGDSMFILVEGLLEVLVKNAHGEAVKVADLGPGTFFGEKSLLTGEPRSATIICATYVVVAEVTKKSMSELFERNMKIAELLSRAIMLRDLQNSKTIDKSDDAFKSENLESKSKQFLQRIKTFFHM